MALYPFDTQTCTLDFQLIKVSDDFLDLKSGNFTYVGPTDLTQYFIKHYDMTNEKIGGRNGVRVYIVLGRRLLSNILTVYLPTILLNLIGHLTVYFKPYFFEVRFIREGFKNKKKLVEYFTKGPTPPPHLLVKKKLLAKKDLHVMKRILYDTCPRLVARWSRERVPKLRYLVLVKKWKKIRLS